MKKINIKGPIVSNSAAWLYKYLGWDAASPNDLRDGLEEAAGDDVVIEINSPGGVCVYGYEMYTMIMEYEGKVTVHVISAMSAATLLVCAADEALISDTGIFMIHNAQSSADGDYRDMQMEADALREFNAGLINAYVRKTGKSREEIQALMDNDTFMSPKTAIENGFIDGYMFGDPDKKSDEPNSLAGKIVASDMQIISEDKATALMKLIMKSADNKEDITELENILGTVKEPKNMGEKKEEIGKKAVSDKEEGGVKMSLDELIKNDPEAQAELETRMAEARAEGRTEGVDAERNRIKSLDAISGTVSAEALKDAKYGENPIDGPTLAYQAMVKGDKAATAYMEAAKKDSEESGVGDVGTGKVDAGQGKTDESDEMAAYINKRKEGK